MRNYNIPASSTTALPTSPTKTPTRLLPPDPSIIRFPNSPLTLTFTDFGRNLPFGDLLHALLFLSLRVTAEILIDKKDSPILQALHFKPDRVLLVVTPTAQMTWGKLAIAIEGMPDFLRQWDWLACNFVVGEDGVGSSGGGFFMYV